jgi:hypothetical protein
MGKQSEAEPTAEALATCRVWQKAVEGARAALQEACRPQIMPR